jgi:rhamnosyltransferase
MKLAAIVVVYYPDLNDLKKNILRYIADVDTLILWDNTPNRDGAPLIIDLPGYEEKIQQLSTGKNEYIAYPLNQVVAWCIANKYTHLLTMDQDSLFEVGSFKLYKNRIQLNLGNNNAIYGVNPNNKFVRQDDFLHTSWCITSGSVYDVTIIKEIGGFREDYKIDCVDNEICFRANTKGYKTVVDTQCVLHQIYGNHQKSIFGFTTLGYSTFRTYSILCNHILLWKEYPQHIGKDLKKEIVKEYFIFRFIKVLLSENKKISKTMALFYGFMDGMSGKRKDRFC